VGVGRGDLRCAAGHGPPVVLGGVDETAGQRVQRTGGDELLVTTGASLVETYKGTFLLGQTLMPCMSALLLGTLMYRSGLVPRAIPLMGLIGAPLLITSTIAVFFGLIEPISAWSAIATLPVALWELSLGLWLTFKGFKPSPITSTRVPPAAAPVALPVG
jgi:hypothetical protein